MEDTLQYYKQAYLEQEAILEVVYDQITVANHDGVFIRISQSCAKNFGIPKEEILGHSCYELEKRGILSSSVTAAVLKSGREVTLIQETKGGKRLMVTGKPLFDEQGKIHRVVNISRDVTMEEKLKSRLQELEDLLALIKQQIRQDHPAGSPLLLGCSPAMQAVFKTIDAVASLNTTVLLQGETGVGKSVYARYIHNLGPSREQPFVQINCGAIPGELIESELFGYAPGSFTGANKKGKEGLLSAAKEGTVFLDEISEMPQPLQVRLLHVLQERSFTRIGDTESRPFRARVISAANRDLKTLVNQGLFREDLYYRLNVVPIVIPPLRERKDDISLLAKHFLQLVNDKYDLHKEISDQALAQLQQYTWPGNVRELENAIERLVVISNHGVIDVEDLDTCLPGFSAMSRPQASGSRLSDILEQVERDVLIQAQQEYRTTRRMAEALGIDQSTVVKKMKKYGLPSEGGSSAGKPTA